MKKIIAVAGITMVMLTGCGNMSMSVGNFDFEKVHVDTYHYNGCLTVEKWHDDATGIEVKTKEAGSIYLSEGTYMLIENECPFCAED